MLTAQEPVADQNVKQREKNLASGEREAKQLLLLMDRDQSGKVSKKSSWASWEAEFERMDINKDGELDVKELTGFRLVPHGGSPHRSSRTGHSATTVSQWLTVIAAARCACNVLVAQF